MSYILDALKKSERERPAGQVPDLFTVHGPQQPSPRRVTTRALVVAALLLALPAFVLWAWIGTDRRDRDPARPPVAASPLLRAEAPDVSVTPPQAAVTTPPGAARVTPRPRVLERSQSSALPAKTPGGTVSRPVVPVETPANPPALAPEPPTLAPEPPAPASEPPAPAATTAEPEFMPLPTQAGGEASGVAASDLPSGDIPAAAAVLSQEPAVEPETAAGAALEEAPPADGRVFDPDDLPAPIRAALPKLVISGHVWSEEPSLRFLSVDDRLLREGDEPVPGVSLQQITASGAVFVFKGWRFRVAGGRP